MRTVSRMPPGYFVFEARPKKYLRDEWRPVLGYEGVYSVSDKGEVWSHRSKIKLSPGTKKDGYKFVCLCWKGEVKLKSIHQLVAEAFLGQSLLDIRHKNHDQADNDIENLEYGTHIENMEDRRKRRGLNLNVDQDKLNEAIEKVNARRMAERYKSCTWPT